MKKYETILNNKLQKVQLFVSIFKFFMLEIKLKNFEFFLNFKEIYEFLKFQNFPHSWVIFYCLCTKKISKLFSFILITEKLNINLEFHFLNKLVVILQRFLPTH